MACPFILALVQVQRLMDMSLVMDSPAVDKRNRLNTPQIFYDH